jgi:hypothetical protein
MMPWDRKLGHNVGYISPSALHYNMASAFKRRKWGTCVTPVICRGRYAGKDLRYWYDYDKVEKRTFEVFYGYNPRCSHKGTWGKPGTFHWKIHNHYIDNHRWL